MPFTMKTVRMEKQSFDGYCVGTGIEYPGIVVWANNDKELRKLFKAAIPAYEEALQKYNVVNKPYEAPKMEIITIDRETEDK